MIRTIQVTYEQPEQQCKREEHCDATVLGGLFKALIRQGLQPLPRSPFIGLSFRDLQCHFGQASLPTLCEYLSSHGERYYYRDRYGRNCVYDKCGIKERINDSLSSVAQRLQGLELE